jgi:hypothetical protein
MQRTISALERLSDKGLEEVAMFANRISGRTDDEKLVKGIQSMVSEGHALDFMSEEDDLYAITDLKERYK